MRLDPVQIAFPLGTDNRLMVDLKSPTDGFKRVRRIGPTAIRHEAGRGTIPEARRIEDHQRRPRGFRWGQRTREDSTGIPLEDENAAPLDAVEGKVHLAAIDEPVL